MYYRVFEVTEPVEQRLFAIHELREGVPLLVEAMSEQGFHITDEDALPLVEDILEKLRDKDGNDLLVRGFDIRTRKDGSRWFTSYRFEYLGVTLMMESAEDREVTREKVVSVWPYGRYTSKVSEVTVPDIVTEVSPYGFDHCLGIRRVIIPEGVREIGRMAFWGCKDLEEVVLPESLTSIGGCAFAGCVGLTSIKLPDRLETIAPLAFCGCEGLERVALPDSVRRLGYGAFAHCPALAEFHAPADLAIPVEKHVFFGCPHLEPAGLRLVRLQPHDREALAEMQDAVELYAALYLNDTNLQHFFGVGEVDEPDPVHLGSRVRDDELPQDICYYFTHSNWIVLDDRVDLKFTREREGTEFMQAVVVDTLRSMGSEVYDATEEGLGYYEEEFNCIELISLRFLYLWGRWHAMTFEWSD